MKRIFAVGAINNQGITMKVTDDDGRVIELTKLDNSWKLQVGSYIAYVASLKEVEKNWIRR